MTKDLKTTIGYIYKITSPNNKIYIGQTINFYKRKGDYKRGYFKRQTKLYNSCNKHNWNPIDTLEVIEECFCGENKIYLNEREVYWIKFYNSYENGLNCSIGGGGTCGYHHSLETRKKISLANKGKKLSEETKKLLAIASAENTNTRGQKRSVDTRKKMSSSQKGKILSEETKNKLKESGKGNKNASGARSEEFKKKMKNLLSGNTNASGERSDEFKEKMRKLQTGKKFSEETKSKMRAAAKNRKDSILSEFANI